MDIVHGRRHMIDVMRLALLLTLSGERGEHARLTVRYR
jgi:hypothetical protein